jgi:hypothetical protein
MLRIRILLPLVVLGCSSPQEPSAPTVEEHGTKIDPSSLIGEWQDVQDSGRTVFHERWNRHTDGSLSGLGFVLSGMDTVFIEHLGILNIDGETLYAATIRSQNSGQAVLFKLIHDRDSLVFANPQHDFPQRIVYAPDGADHWNVVVSGVEKGQAQTDHYHFARRGPETAS